MYLAGLTVYVCKEGEREGGGVGYSLIVTVDCTANNIHHLFIEVYSLNYGPML